MMCRAYGAPYSRIDMECAQMLMDAIDGREVHHHFPCDVIGSRVVDGLFGVGVHIVHGILCTGSRRRIYRCR